MMRKLDTSDFEAANIEYVSFWLLDPFIYTEDGTLIKNTTSTARGGDLYINLGEVSEDILKDGKKFFENGLPIDGDMTKTEETVWGRVPRDRSVVYAFDNTSGARRRQDVGLNGLSTEDERTFSTYQKYLNEYKASLMPKLTRSSTMTRPVILITISGVAITTGRNVVSWAL